jgi:hypothetical protein
MTNFVGQSLVANRDIFTTPRPRSAGFPPFFVPGSEREYSLMVGSVGSK